ncbi:putative inorganic phosphate cotransporter [Parasteatoda tepidariorum]|uniref:putative inorganic phosphate cotransporter n=1 Tax=Parasteatoda tepidariorum TaxID=114398 RepID=UPI0039BD189A
MKFQCQLINQKWERFYFPKRYIVAILGFLGIFNIFTMRVSMSMSIVAMVNHTYESTINSSYSETEECQNLEHRNTALSEDNLYKGNKYNWDSTIQATILGSYYYGYILTQLPAGVLAEKFGAKWLFGGGLFVTAVFSLLTPVFTAWGPVVLSTLRALQGLADGVTIPSINLIISTWSPKNERSRLSTIIFTGGQIGMVTAMPIAALLCSTDLLGGWPSVFYVFEINDTLEKYLHISANVGPNFGSLWTQLWIYDSSNRNAYIP